MDPETAAAEYERMENELCAVVCDAFWDEPSTRPLRTTLGATLSTERCSTRCATRVKKAEWRKSNSAMNTIRRVGDQEELRGSVKCSQFFIQHARPYAYDPRTGEIIDRLPKSHCRSVRELQESACLDSYYDVVGADTLSARS
jgi:hypothetical protein